MLDSVSTSSLRPLSTIVSNFMLFFSLKTPVNITYVNIKVYQTPLTFLFFKSVAQNQCKNNRQVQSANIHSNILFCSLEGIVHANMKTLSARFYITQVNENWAIDAGQMTNLWYTINVIEHYLYHDILVINNLSIGFIWKSFLFFVTKNKWRESEKWEK